MWICDKDEHCIDCPRNYSNEECEHYIEVQVIKRGKWEVCDILDYAQRPLGRKILRCPFCGYLTDEFMSIVDYNHERTNFCPNCGAKMDQENIE